MEDYSEAYEFLKSKAAKGQVLATLIQAERDEIVITAVASEGESRAFTRRVKIMDKNETLNGVLLKDQGGRFSDFPADFPCLRLDPPHIDENWPEWPDEDQRRFY